jgi:hypothetical protein
VVGPDRVAGAKWHSNRVGQRRYPTAPQPIDNSLEALSHLLYLIRLSLDDPAKATSYLDFADQVLIDIAANRSPTGGVMGAHHASADGVDADGPMIGQAGYLDRSLVAWIAPD